tara:strand:- start:526 stop:714 length:189 start_codon:yes stop_codon:yes gene_type:complete
MGKVLSAAKWSFDLLAQRINAVRSRKPFNLSRIYGLDSYDESQMRDDDVLKRQQKAEIEYDC